MVQSLSLAGRDPDGRSVWLAEVGTAEGDAVDEVLSTIVYLDAAGECARADLGGQEGADAGRVGSG